MRYLQVVSSDMTTFPTTHVLLGDWETWMRAQSWSDRTIDERTILIRRVSREALKPAELLDLNDVLSFLAHRFDASTRQTYFVNIASWFRWLVLSGNRADNPMGDVKIPRAPRTRPHPLTTAHVQHAIANASRRRTRMMILLAAYQGLRASEIAKFHSDDLDLIGKQLHVTGKGGLRAVLPLSPIIERESQTFGPGWWFPQYKPNKLGESGGHILGRSVSTLVSGALRRAGINGTTHSLRHWFASEMLRQGVDIRVIQELMRHASLATTERYLHVDADQTRAGVLVLPDLTQRVTAAAILSATSSEAAA